jgi:hypothetical protein
VFYVPVVDVDDLALAIGALPMEHGYQSSFDLIVPVLAFRTGSFRVRFGSEEFSSPFDSFLVQD